MENKKFAYELKPGDKLESEQGIFVVARAHTMGENVSVIGHVGGQLTAWGLYNKMDQFVAVEVH